MLAMVMLVDTELIEKHLQYLCDDIGDWMLLVVVDDILLILMAIDGY